MLLMALLMMCYLELKYYQEKINKDELYDEIKNYI